MASNTRPRVNQQHLEDVREGLARSVEYFGSRNKAERERWVAREFVRNLNVRARESSFVSPLDDPPDVQYRGCRFEVKEVLDAGRRRHQEYRDELARAHTAADSADLLKQYTPKEISPAGVGELVLGQVHALSMKYEPKLKRSLDLLVYVNLLEHTLDGDEMPEWESFAGHGWRSISALIGWCSLVFCAERETPRFLRVNEHLPSVRRGGG
jgi:hypothetical protein